MQNPGMSQTINTQDTETAVRARHYLFIALCAAFPVALGAANVLLAVCAIACITLIPWKTTWRTLASMPTIWCVLALSAWMSIGILYTTAPTNDWLLHVKKYIKIPLIVLWVALLAGHTRAMASSWQAFAISMAFIAISTWLNVWFILPWSETQVVGWGLSHHVIGDYITQNVMMSLFVLWLLIQAHRQRGHRRFFWLIAALLAAVTITHLSQGRTGYVLLSISLLVFTMTRLHGKQIIIGIGTIIGALTILLATSETMLSRFQQAVAEAQLHDKDPHSSIGHRIFNYKITPELIKDRPILGWGTGSYHSAICTKIPAHLSCSVYNWHPHNQYLFFGVEHGILGILAYAALLVCMAWTALRAPRAGLGRPLLLGLTALLAVDSLFNSPLWSARESHFFTIMAGLLVAMAHTERAHATTQKSADTETARLG